MNPICQASYSNVPVWVQSVNGVSLMRRQHDGWVNATHLLKIANFDKPRRTRILERDVQSGVHEKVQGGYGKYQGTWVPVERAAALARDFGIYEDVSAMLDYVDDGRNELPQAPTISNKRSSTSNIANQAANGTPARRGRKSASLPSRQASARLVQPQPAQPTKSINLPPQPPVQHQQHQQQFIPSQAQAHIGGLYAGAVPLVNSPQQFYADQSQQQVPNYYPQVSHTYQQAVQSRPQRTLSSSSGGYSSSDGESDGEWSQLVHSRDPSRGSADASKGTGEDQAVDSPLSASVPNSQGRTASGGQPSAGATQYANTLLNYFMAPNKNDILELLRRPHPEFLVNEVIDSEGHTPFHWAAAMGLVAVMEALISLNANPMAQNYAGKTPLARAVHFTNNYDLRSFPRVLDLLGDSLFHVEPQGETLLHSIAFTAASRSKIPSARYYLEQSLARMTELRGPNYVHQFMSRQNASGDTALHLAARNGARKLVRVFLRSNAPREIPNRSGRTANDYILEYEASRRPQHQRQHQRQDQLQQQSQQSQLSDPTVASAVISTPGGGKRRRRPGLGALAGGLPHASEAAIQATQQVAAQLAEHLEELAQSYDAELETKDSDIEQVRQLLKQVKEHTRSVQAKIPELQSRMGPEEQASEQLRQLGDKNNQMAVRLRQVLERTQARDLAHLVQSEEEAAQELIQQQIAQGEVDHVQSWGLARELSELQTRRQQTVDEIVKLYSQAGSGKHMDDYRRLIALSCGAEPGEVDSLLDGIEQALEEKQ